MMFPWTPLLRLAWFFRCECKGHVRRHDDSEDNLPDAKVRDLASMLMLSVVHGRMPGRTKGFCAMWFV